VASLRDDASATVDLAAVMSSAARTREPGHVAMQRCGARGWSPDYIDHRGDLAREALGSIDIAWNRDSWQHLRSTAQVAIPASASILLTHLSLRPTLTDSLSMKF
jgi:hypothetical protein